MSEKQKNSYPKPKLVPVPSTNIDRKSTRLNSSHIH